MLASSDEEAGQNLYSRGRKPLSFKSKMAYLWRIPGGVEREVSVVPFHNESVNISRCVEVLLPQLDASVGHELIFVDSASTDRSAEILAEYPRVTVVRVNALNAYTARNAGVKAARGRWIAFTDADCLVSPGWLAAITEAAEEPRNGLLLGPNVPCGGSRLLHALHDYENAQVAGADCAWTRGRNLRAGLKAWP